VVPWYICNVLYVLRAEFHTGGGSAGSQANQYNDELVCFELEPH
jgi:hypothetical protein